MRDLVILFVHLIATFVRLLGPGGLRSVVAESVLVKQQLLILNRSHLRTEAYRLLYGVDVTQIPGVETIALPLFSEVGRDLFRFPTAAHFVSWLGLCPDNTPMAA